jgi:tetratricopeptide (TPR) repeat protein
MKSAVIGVLAAAFLLTFGLAIAAWAEETPKADPKVVDKSEKAAAPIKAQMAVAEKLLQQSSEEMAKPDGKRDFKKADGFKASAGNTYIAAALAAVRAAAALKDAEKQAFLDLYDKPNREKAISIFLELGDAAKATRKWQEATGYYNKVLQIDPKNEAAATGIKAVKEGMKTANPDKDNNPKKHH